MNTQKIQTIAEYMAERMGNDGSSISDVEIDVLNCSGIRSAFFYSNRWEFSDGSAICELNGMWDIEKPGEPYSWRG